MRQERGPVQGARGGGGGGNPAVLATFSLVGVVVVVVIAVVVMGGDSDGPETPAARDDSRAAAPSSSDNQSGDAGADAEEADGPPIAVYEGPDRSRPEESAVTDEMTAGMSPAEATALLVPAIETFDDEAVERLVAAGADVNILYRGEPLLLGLFDETEGVLTTRRCVAALTAGGADPHLADAQGHTGLHRLALAGPRIDRDDIEVIRPMYHDPINPANQLGINPRDHAGYTPLQLLIVTHLPSATGEILAQNQRSGDWRLRWTRLNAPVPARALLNEFVKLGAEDGHGGRMPDGQPLREWCRANNRGYVADALEGTDGGADFSAGSRYDNHHFLRTLHKLEELIPGYDEENDMDLPQTALIGLLSRYADGDLARALGSTEYLNGWGWSEEVYQGRVMVGMQAWIRTGRSAAVTFHFRFFATPDGFDDGEFANIETHALAGTSDAPPGWD